MPDRLARVLVHPLRHRLLYEYQGEPANPGEVARRLHEPLNLVSYHTSVLARHGCVELVRTERRRGALTHFYRSKVGPVIEDGQWASVPGPVRRALVLGTLGLATDEARGAALAGGFDDPASHLSRSTLLLDDEGVQAVARCLREALERIARIGDGAGGERRPYRVVLLGFEPQPQRRQIGLVDAGAAGSGDASPNASAAPASPPSSRPAASSSSAEEEPNSSRTASSRSL